MTNKLKQDIRGLLSLLRQAYEDDIMSPMIDEGDNEERMEQIDATIKEWNRQIKIK